MSIEPTRERKAEGRHTFPVDYPVLTLAEIGALNTAVVAADAAAEEGRARRRAAEVKRAALEDRLASVPVASADGIGELEAGLADALAADPASVVADEEIAAATERRVEARRSRESLIAQREIIQQAIAKVDGEIAQIGSEIEALGRERAKHWKAFLDAAHAFLIDRFRTAFTSLVTDSLQAIVDLQHIEIEGRQLVPYTAWKVERDSSIKLRRQVPYERWNDGLGEPATGSDDDRADLFTFDYDYAAVRLGKSAALDRFRASLPGSATL